MMNMTADDKKQWAILGILISVYGLLALVTYLFIPLEQLTAGQPMPAMLTAMPRWLFGVASMVFIVILYGLLGLAGFWFSSQLGLPKVYRVAGGWKNWILGPMIWGLAIGVIMVVADRIIASVGGVQGFPHPAFPFSLIASASAGIGEEILFRFFVMGLWAYLLNLILKSRGGPMTALWIGNVIAALIFSASHIPAAMVLLNIKSFTDIPVPYIVELVVLNGVVGLAAGNGYIRYGLVAAMGIHFWADIVWHVIWPLMG